MSPMNKLAWNLVPRYIPTKIEHELWRIASGRAVMGSAGQSRVGVNSIFSIQFQFHYFQFQFQFQFHYSQKVSIPIPIPIPDISIPIPILIPGSSNPISIPEITCWFLAATKQLYDWFSPSLCLSVCPSHLYHHVSIIVSSWNFQELLPWSEVISTQKVKVRGQRWRSQRSTPNLAVSGLKLQFKFTYGNEIMHTAGSSIEEVPYCFSRSSVKFQGHTALKIVEFDPDWAFPDCNSSLNTQMATKWCTKLEVA